MARWWPFGRKRGKEAEEAPARPPEAPAPAPAGEAPAAEEKKGLLGRLRQKVRPRKEAPAPKEAPAEPSPAPEPSEGPAGTASQGPLPGMEGPEPSGSEEAEAPRQYPGSLYVEAEGDWVISQTMWSGTMSGSLHGADVKTFLDAMEQDPPDYDTAIPLVGDAYGIPGELINIGESTIRSVNWH
ncbi:hypothetical protein [Streptomyces sp. WMMB303]|uniref:hypothetical protein n=1 Tax=Streptomyces sp. WMMB303 TaxID=3034154 RepID=UPI0023ED4687|nr:hypothetical protein [Streptomyces sp. WMMB303]MDF4254713.1 hypothetical protein [Streptomyces sp. WMMB303]